MTAQDCDQVAGLGCNDMSVCQQIKLAGPGEVCGLVGMDAVFCSGGGSCKVGMGGSGTCLAPAADGQACSTTDGPPCLAPATCVNDVCKISDPASCK